MALVFHLRYSPVTSPYRFPWLYKSFSDMLSLPIYTHPVIRHMEETHHFPLLLQGTTQEVDHSFNKYGSKQGNVLGLNLTEGFSLIRSKEHYLHLWQIGLW